MKTISFTSGIALAIVPAAAQTSAVPPASNEAQTAPQPSPRAPACVSEAHRQFDFWVGEWDVFPNGGETKVADSRIENLYGGCAIRENWMPLSGTGGGSLNSYDADLGQWRQAWVDSSGTRVDFTGGMVGGTMVLTGLWRDIGGPGKDALVRMNYSVESDGSVRQHGEQSTDFGKSWTTAFDLVYRRKDAGTIGD